MTRPTSTGYARAQMASSRRAPTYEPAQFLNVDLEIGARGKLDALASELSPPLFELYRGDIGALHHAHYEIGGCASDADTTMLALVEAVQQLTPAARRLWDRAKLRDFNIGIQGGLEPGHLELAIATTTLTQVAALGGRVVVTVYPPCPTDLKPPALATRQPRRSRAARQVGRQP